MREREGGRTGGGGGGPDTELKTETPHVNVGNNILKMYFRQTRQVVSRQYITSTKH